MSQRDYIYRVRLAAAGGRERLYRFLRRMRWLFGSGEWAAIEATWDLGRLHYNVLQEFRFRLGMPSDPNGYYQHPTVAGEAVQSIVEPSYYRRRMNDLRSKRRVRVSAP